MKFKIMYNSDFHISRYGIEVRLVNEDDAEFIYKLRSDKELTKFISQVDGTLEEQIQWIRQYKLREKDGLEYYLIFSYNGERVGLARLYKIEDDHFTQGSWLFHPSSPAGCSILGNIISCELGFELEGKKYMLTDARIGNSTHRYVKTFHPEIVEVTDLDVFYRITKENYYKYKTKHIELAQKVLSLQKS